MPRRIRICAAAASAALAALSLTGCGLSTASASADSLTIYTSRPDDISKGVVAEFEKENPKYQGKVNVLTMGAQELLERVRAESSRPQAGIWWGGTTQQFDQGVASGLLAPAPQDVAGRVPAQFRGPHDLWLGEMRMAQVIAYNPQMLSAAQAPKDWDDLVTPAFRKKIVIRDVAASGTMESIFSAMVGRSYHSTGSTRDGYRWLTALDANTEAYAANPTDLYLRLQRQEAPVTVWNLQDVELQRAKGAPMTPVAPASGAPMLLDGVGKIKGGPDSAAADAFLRFLLSAKTQQGLADKDFQLPTVPLKQQPGWLSALKLKEMPVDWAQVNSHEHAWITYWSEHIKGRG